MRIFQATSSVVGCFLLQLLIWHGTSVLAQNSAKADSLFEAANTKSKVSMEHLDSALITDCIADYTQAIKLNPKLWQAYRNRSRLLLVTKKYDHALRDLNKAMYLADKASLVNLYDMRAQVYYEMARYKEAIDDWTIVIKGLGNPAYAYLHRAKAKWQLGQHSQGCDDFSKALQLDSNVREQKEFLNCN